jgi:hypothetical protein
MTSTSTHTARRGQGRTDTGAASSALRAASRELLATAGNQVLQAAVDRAVGRVDQAADRLDAVAAGEGRGRRATTSRERAEGPNLGRVARAGQAVQVGMGAAFSMVVRQVMRVIELIRRLAQQLVAALARLAQRAGKAGPVSRAGEPRRTDRTAPSSRTDQVERTGGRRDGRDSGSAPPAARSPQAARRSALGPLPKRRAVVGEPSRSDRVGTGSNDRHRRIAFGGATEGRSSQAARPSSRRGPRLDRSGRREAQRQARGRGAIRRPAGGCRRRWGTGRARGQEPGVGSRKGAVAT